MRWRRTIRWAISTFAVLVLSLLAAAYVVLRSGAFQQYALRKIKEEVSQSTGATANARSLAIRLSTLTAHLHDIDLHGTESDAKPELLHIDDLAVTLNIHSLLHRRLTLRELVIQHPVLHIETDRHGRNNIPTPPPSSSTSHTSIFNLAIGRVALTDGVIFYNDAKTSLDADADHLQSHATFDRVHASYIGNLSYSKGRLKYGQYSPIPHSMSLEFEATPSELSLDSLLVRIGTSTASLNANLKDFNSPIIAGDYDFQLHAQDLANLLPAKRASGGVRAAGKFDYQPKSNQPFIDCIDLTGQLESVGLLAETSQGTLDIHKLFGRYKLSNGNLLADGINVSTLGGEIRGRSEVRNLDTTPTAQVHAVVRGISLGAAQRAVHRAFVNGVNVSGTLNGTADATWTGDLKSLKLSSDATVHADAQPRTSDSSTVPLDAVVHATYEAHAGRLTLRQTTLRTPSVNVSADGQVSQRSSLHIHAQSNDLRQLETLISTIAQKQTAPAISGSATLDADLQRSLKNPQIAGELRAQDLHVAGSDWKTVGVSFTATPSLISASRGSLVNAKQGRTNFDGGITLRNWNYTPESAIHANLSIQQMSVADLQQLAGVNYPISGNLSGQISIAGSQLNPLGSGSLRLTDAQTYGEPLQHLAAKFEASNGSVTSALDVASSAGRASANLTYGPKTRAYKLRIDVPAIDLQKMRALQAKQIRGALSVSAEGEGTLDNPQLNAILRIPKLEVQQKTIEGLKAHLQVANKRATLTADSQVASASINVRGQTDLTGDYQTEASINTGRIPLAALLATVSHYTPDGVQGQTELHATLKGPLKDKAHLEAHITIPMFTASYEQLQIGSAGPIQADYENSTLHLQPVELRGTDTSIHLQGTIPFADSAAPSLSAQGSIDARILRIFEPDLQSSGSISLDIRAGGSVASPSVQGQAHVRNVSLNMTGAPVGVESMNGTLAFSNDRIQISSMSGEVGGGKVSLSGAITYHPTLQFALALQENSVRLRYPVGMRTVLDGTLGFNGNMQASTLTGRILIDSLSFTPDFDLATFSDQFSTNVLTPAQPGFADTVRLGIAVQSKENLSANSSQISVEGDVGLHVIGTAADPVITGRTDLTSGELFYRSNRYQLQRGVITFADPNQTSPELNVSVTTTVEQYKLTVNLRGTLDRLTTSYSSDPPLAATDIIHLIAFGNTSSESAANSASQSTDSMLASSAIGTGLTSGIQKLAGISSLQIDPLLGGDNQNPGARIALQQRVSKNFLFTFSTDVSQPGQELVQGDYQINPRWSVTVTRDQTGGVSVAGRLHTKF